MIARRSRPAAVLVLALAASGLVGCLPAATRGSDAAGASAAAGMASGSPSIAPTSAPSPSFGRPTPTPAPTFFVYTVKAGDNLNSIAHQFGTTGRSIAYWNAATYPSLDPESPQYQPGLLKIGWTLQVIPNVTFDEQTLPEPSDLIDDTPSEDPDSSDAAPSVDGS